ncbi:MAG: class I SAM-dependent methyltransferase [Spirochaetota bacterium]
MKNKQPVCPVCGSSRVAYKYRIERHNFSVHACAGCGSEFQYPLPRNADAYYDEGYYTGSASFSYQDERKAERYHNYVHFARLKTILAVSGAMRLKLLDVGCAFGAFARAAARFGDAYGLDVSKFAVSEGNKICQAVQSPAKLFEGDLAHLPKTAPAKKIFRPGTFSAITLIEVAEHLAQPRAAMQAAFELLAPGGVLVLQTANFEGQQALQAGAGYHYYLPGHLVYYTATGLRRMLAEIGFREFQEFFPTDFPLWAKWRKAWGDVKKPGDLLRFWRMSVYHIQSKFRRGGRPLTSSYVLYAIK